MAPRGGPRLLSFPERFNNASSRRSLRLALTLSLIVPLGAGGPACAADAAPDLTAIGLEAVMNLEVSSVSKKAEKLMDAAAAITVLTSDDIRRSGATNIPDLLRLVPGLQVARVDSSQWAVGIRGMASSLSRSLLVLIDGRSVYSPLFAGVYWDTQDTLLDDIDRIEVIRGPGATLWGANAVNGVINIITKSARLTRGTYASVTGGNEDRVIAAGRFGGTTSKGMSYRAYGKYFDRDAEFHPSGPDYDDWHMGRAGFRADSAPGGANHLTLQGDIYDGKAGEQATLTSYTAPYSQTVHDDADLSGGNLLGRWERKGQADSDTTLQAYYDRTHRRQPGIEESRDTFDVDFRNRIRINPHHELNWGAGYRLTSGATESIPTTQVIPPKRTDNLLSAFVQDEIRIVPSRWTLTVGSKFEHNDYSGFNFQPNLRLVFNPSSRQVFWSSIARALRVPSRIEHDLALTALFEPSTPTFFRLLGNKDFQPEQLISYEIGYRAQAAARTFIDLAIFYHDYDRLLSLETGTPFSEASPPPAHTVIPLVIENKMTGDLYGGEISCDWRPLSRWRLTGSYSYLRINLTADADSVDASTAPSTEGASPRQMADLISSLELPRHVRLGVTLRYVGSLPSRRVDAYTEMDLRVSRTLGHGLELSVAGENLLSPHHAEFSGSLTEIQRSVTGRLVFRW